jgi:sugar phosphate isomerase/epimerase
MNYGLAAWGLRLTPLRDQLAMTKRLELRHLELGIAGFRNDLLQADSPNYAVETVRNLFLSAGIQPSCAATGNDFTLEKEAEVQKSLEQTLVALQLADMLGIRYLRIFAGFSPVADVTGKRYDLLVECLKKVYEAAKETQVLPVVETHGGVEVLSDGTVRHFSSISTEDETLEKLLNDIPDMQLNFDPANLHVLGKDVVAFYRHFKEKIAYLHLKDFARKGMGWIPVACGEGNIDWSRLLLEMRSFKGLALLEYEIPDDAERGFSDSLKYLLNQENNCAF